MPRLLLLLLLSCTCLWRAPFVDASGCEDITAGWRLASSTDLSGGGGSVYSLDSYNASSWLALEHFPSTVLGAVSLLHRLPYNILHPPTPHEHAAPM